MSVLHRVQKGWHFLASHCMASVTSIRWVFSTECQLSATPLYHLGLCIYRYLTGSLLINPSLCEPIMPLPYDFLSLLSPAAAVNPLVSVAHLSQIWAQGEALTVWPSLHTQMGVPFHVLVCLHVPRLCLAHHSECGCLMGGTPSAVQNNLWQIDHQQPSHQMAYPQKSISKAYGPQRNHPKPQHQVILNCRFWGWLSHGYPYTPCNNASSAIWNPLPYTGEFTVALGQLVTRGIVYVVVVPDAASEWGP